MYLKQFNERSARAKSSWNYKNIFFPGKVILHNILDLRRYLAARFTDIQISLLFLADFRRIFLEERNEQALVYLSKLMRLNLSTHWAKNVLIAAISVS